MASTDSLAGKLRVLYEREWRREPNRQANLVRRVPQGDTPVSVPATELLVVWIACLRLHAELCSPLQSLLKAVAFFSGAVLVARTWGEAFAV